MSTLNLSHALHRGWREYPGHFALIDRSSRYTYGQLADRVSRLAGGLEHWGLENRGRVAIIASNSNALIEAMLSVWWAGGVLIPLNTRWSLDECVEAINDCDTKILYLAAEYGHWSKEIRQRCPGVIAIIGLGETSLEGIDVNSESLIRTSQPVDDAFCKNDDLAAIFYSGGTTGKPKGIMQSHGSLTSGVLLAAAAQFCQRDDRVLVTAPLFHIAGCVFSLVALLNGATQVLEDFTPAGVLEVIDKLGITVCLFVPTMMQLLIAQSEDQASNLDTVERIVYGASPISESLLTRAMNWLPNADFIQCYGQSELGGVVSVLAPEAHHRTDDHPYLRSAGRPAIGVEVKIVDENMSELEIGSVGQIAVRSPGSMLGYWQRQSETLETMTDDWVLTGDAGYLDHQGYLFVVDRVKDMIISGGENIFSVEVECVIREIVAVSDCAVIGVPHPRWGEAVHAVIVRRAGCSLSEREVITYCRSRIAHFKCPASVAFVEALPVSGVGKTLKQELRRRYAMSEDLRC